MKKSYGTASKLANRKTNFYSEYICFSLFSSRSSPFFLSANLNTCYAVEAYINPINLFSIQLWSAFRWHFNTCELATQYANPSMQLLWLHRIGLCQIRVHTTTYCTYRSAICHTMVTYKDETNEKKLCLLHQITLSRNKDNFYYRPSYEHWLRTRGSVNGMQSYRWPWIENVPPLYFLEIFFPSICFSTIGQFRVIRTHVA